MFLCYFVFFGARFV